MIFVFDDVEIDLDGFEIRRSGRPVPVEPQVFDVIRMLLDSQGKLVTKEELLDSVWGTRFVSESSLTSRIRAARRALGDDGRAQRVIATIHGRGYRFVASAKRVDGRSANRPTVPLPPSPLLERDDALLSLDDAVRTAAEGHGQVVLLAGEAGIGKTSLVNTFSAGLGVDVRQFRGACDDLITPRALGPFDDMSPDIPALADVLLNPSSGDVQRILMDELTSGDGPSLMIVDDAHWADEATIDVLVYLVRRIERLPVTLILTFRDNEVVSGHPLLRVLGGVPPASARHVRLQPLSVEAIAELVGEHRAVEVAAATGGIPFFVTEVAALDPHDRSKLPTSVTHAVLARVSTMPETTRAVLEQISVEPSRTSTIVLDQLHPTWPEAVAASDRMGITTSSHESVSYRHELARRAVLESMPEPRRRALHQAMADALVAADADPDRIVHHAHAADDRKLLIDHAIPAAERSRAASAHRQAWSHLQRVLPLIDQFAPADTLHLLETASLEAYHVDELDEARVLADRALRAAESLADEAAAGRLHRWLSRLHWSQGRTADAHREAARSIELLEALPPSEELAWAYSTMSQVAMLSWDYATTRHYVQQALETAESVGADAVRAHALINLAMGAEVDVDIDLMSRAVAEAERTGQHHEVVRGLIGIAYTAVESNRLDEAEDYARQALHHAVEHEIETLRFYVEAILARSRFLRGHWDEAESRLRSPDGTRTSVNHMVLLHTRSQLAVRRGDEDAEALLAQQRVLVDRSGEHQRVLPAIDVEAEHAWLHNELDAMSSALREALPAAMLSPPHAGRIGRWLREVDALDEIPAGVPEPYVSELEGRWTDAAAGWNQRGMPYEEAMALARVGPEGIERAREIATRLAASPLLARIENR